MKGDGVLNLLIFQAFQDVRMASSLVRSTIDLRRGPYVGEADLWEDPLGLFLFSLKSLGFHIFFHRWLDVHI